MDILREAIKVTTQRQKHYDKPERNLQRIADFWNAYAKNKGWDITIEAKDVAMLNILQKMSREIWAYKADNWVDIAGYAHVGHKTIENQPITKSKRKR